MCKPVDLKHFRTITGAERKAAMRAHLSKHDGVLFGMDPHAIPFSQQCALAEMAKAVSWKKSISSSLSLGLAFYVYLSRDVQAPIVRGPVARNTGGPKRGPAISFGRGFA
jgi:hypothetical protein